MKKLNYQTASQVENIVFHLLVKFLLKQQIHESFKTESFKYLKKGYAHGDTLYYVEKEDPINLMKNRIHNWYNYDVENKTDPFIIFEHIRSMFILTSITFVWSDTKNGHTYWDSMFDKWRHFVDSKKTYIINEIRKIKS